MLDLTADELFAREEDDPYVPAGSGGGDDEEHVAVGSAVEDRVRVVGFDAFQSEAVVGEPAVFRR